MKKCKREEEKRMYTIDKKYNKTYRQSEKK